MSFSPTVTRIVANPNEKEIKNIKYKYINIKTKKEITNEQYLEYIYSLKIPPIWKNVKISLNKKSKIAVIGYDSAGRRQYLYTENHNEHVRKKKYKNLIELAEKYDKIKKELEKEIKKSNLTKVKIIAIIIKIIMHCNFRIGTEKGVKLYNSTGITTLKKKHIKINSKNLEIKFIGKKGVVNHCFIKKKEDNLLYDNIINLTDKKKKEDFVFLANGDRIDFLDINNYLKKYGNITSKAFRTLSANITLLQYLPYYFEEKKEKKRKKYINMIIKEHVAPALHHTVAISKKSYLLKELLNMYNNDPKLLKNIIKPNSEYLYKTKNREEIYNLHKKNKGKKISYDEAKKYFINLLNWFTINVKITIT